MFGVLGLYNFGFPTKKLVNIKRLHWVAVVRGSHLLEKIVFNRLLTKLQIHAEEKRDADAASALSYLCIKLFNDSLT